MRSWVVLAVAAALLVAAPAGAVPPRQCDPLPHYSVIAHGVKCSFARKWVRRFVRSGREPKGYTCSAPSGSNVKAQCLGREKPKGDPQYRYYYGIAK